MYERFKVMDCQISRVCMETAISSVRERAESNAGGYVCFSNVHSIVTSKSDVVLRRITNESLMSMPDGKPVAALAKCCGIRGVAQVPGPDFMLRFILETPNSKHYLYGSTKETIELLIGALEEKVPHLNIVGGFSPPFRELTEKEEASFVKEINNISPDYIWVGLGAPKQEYWMAKYWPDLRPAVLFGVGAAFDFHAGTKSRAPGWMRRIGLEWLHRLASEPRRLWRRYLYTNTIFLFYTLKTLLSRCSLLRVKSQ